MAITNNLKPPPTTTTSKPSAPAGGTGEAARTGAAAGIKQAANAYAKSANTPSVSDAAAVQISPKAREMSQARQIVADTPDIREDKVAKFRDLIAKGEYKPDSSKIADGIMKEAIRDELSKAPETALE